MQDQTNTVRLTYKYRLYPTKEQDTFLEGQLSEACDLYNCALQERIGAWKTCRKSISFYDQVNQLKEMRSENCLSIVNFSCAQNVLWRLDRAFNRFFCGINSRTKCGYPRFRSLNRYDSITYPRPDSGWKLIGNSKIKIQGAGHIKLNLHRPIVGNIRTVTIKREAGKWYVFFSVQKEAAYLANTEKEIGIDMGIEQFSVRSDGTSTPNPQWYRKSHHKLRRCQRKVARRKKGSKRRRKAVLLLQRAHAHVKNQRSDFHHKVSDNLVNNYGMIAVEDLNVKGLAASILAKSVNDAGWSQFLRFLAYKAEYAGRRLVKVDPRGTSQTCVCGARVTKTLRDRWHNCPECGLCGSRDHVSAQVILQRARSAPSGDNAEVVDSYVA